MLIDGDMTKAGDVFSFGVILWELLTGKRAWANASLGQVIFIVTVKGDTLQPPPDAPPAYAAIVNACMAVEKSERPTFEEIIPKLETLLEELPPVLPVEEAVQEPAIVDNPEAVQQSATSESAAQPES